MNLSFNSSINPLIAECKDTSEKIDLYEKYGLYIKPIARLNITIQLPPTKTPGQAVSTNEIIEKVKKLSLPEEFIYLRVIKSTLEFIRCEGEIENKSSFKTLLSKLDGCTIKMNAYTDLLKLRAAEAKISYSTRHDWETFFKDSSNPTDELKPGERPDTIHLADLPCKWFADRKTFSKTCSDSFKPSENIVKEVFSFFGELRMIDIPYQVAQSAIKKQFATNEIVSSFSNNNLNLNTFEAFIQYKDYISFVKAMDAFRGMKLLYIDNDNGEAFSANIRVDFDRSRHLSDSEIKKREIDKLKAIELEKIRNAQIEKEKDKEAKQREIATYRLLLEESGEDGKNSDNIEQKSKEQRRREREEIRRQKKLAKKQKEEEKKLEVKIALEERKILIAQRKLESMRLLEELFNRVKVIVSQEELEKRQKEMKEAKIKRKIEEENEELFKKQKQELMEQELREKIEKNLAKHNKIDDTEDVEKEEFELRKDTLAKQNENNIIENPTNQHLYVSSLPMPRAVLLSNPQLQQAIIGEKPKLYDEEISISNEAFLQKDSLTLIRNENIEICKKNENANEFSHKIDNDSSGEIKNSPNNLNENDDSTSSTGEILSAETSVENVIDNK